MTQVSAPPQMQPEAIPCTARRPSRAGNDPAKPKAVRAVAKISRPMRVVGRTPIRVASQPPMRAPGIRPAVYAAASTPTWAFEAPTAWA